MKIKHLSLLLLAAITAVSCNDNNETDNTRELAQEAYIYAFAAVENNKAIGQILALNPDGVNKFTCKTELATPNDKVIVTPNNDTYYGSAVLDLRYEPVVISIPEIEGRYFSIQLADIFTNCPNYVKLIPGKTGTQNFLITLALESDQDKLMPEPLPAGIDERVGVTATVIFALARTQALPGDTPEKAAALQAQYSITPLSQFLGSTPPENREPLLWPTVYDSKTGGIEEFFDMFNFMVQFQQLTEEDKRLMNRYAEIGLKAGEPFKKEQFAKEVWGAIETGALNGRETIESGTKSTSQATNGWTSSPKNSGNWGTDYYSRALVAWQYIYVNTLEEAIYFTGMKDKNANDYDGANYRYTLTFPKDGLPPNHHFWSLTMYTEAGFLSENSIDRYALSSTVNELNVEPDGTTVLYIQHENPGSDKEANWLPAPKGKFYVVFRVYGPEQAVTSGDYILPGLMRE